MFVNKVIHDGTVIMDLTEDTVTKYNLQMGVTAHDRSGAVILGTDDYDSFVIAETFDEDKSYNIGDYVIFEGLLYRFVYTHNPGEWDFFDVVETNVSEELKLLKESASNVIEDAPNDGREYLRMNDNWISLESKAVYLQVSGTKLLFPSKVISIS